MKAISIFFKDDWRKKIVLLLGVLTLTAVVYSHLPSCDFCFIDDPTYLWESHLIKDFSPIGVQNILASFWEEQLPLTHLSFAVDYKLWGFVPGPYHAENVVFHILNVALAFIFIYLLCRSYEVALLTSLLFAIHPFRVESVAWIAERKDVLYSFFYFLGLICYIFYIRSKFKIRFLVSVLFFFILSLLSKTAAINFPFILFLVDYYENRKIDRRIFSEKLPFFLVIGILLWVHSRVALAQQTEVYFAAGFEFWERVLMASYAFSYYVIAFFIPANLCLVHPYPMKSFGQLPFLYYTAPIFVLLFLWGMDILVKRFKEERKEILFGLFFFLFSIVLVLHLFPIGGMVIVAERYTYVAYLGLFFIAAKLFANAMTSFSPQGRIARILLVVFLIGYVIFFSLTAFVRTKVWSTSDLLRADIIEKNPNWYVGYHYRAEQKAIDGDFFGALRDYSIVIGLAPGEGVGYFSRGILKTNMGDYPGALSDFAKAISLVPEAKHDYIYWRRALTHMGREDYISALADYSKIIALGSQQYLTRAYAERGKVRRHLHDDEGALADFTKAIELKPDFHGAYFERGILHLSQKQFDKALNDFNKALEIDSRMAGAYFNRAVCYMQAHEYEKAWGDVHQVQRMGERIPERFLKELDSKMPEPRADFMRSKGLTVYFIFREVAQIGNMPRGFIIDLGTEKLVLFKPTALVNFYLEQQKSIRENGIWLVGADTKKYSRQDREMEGKLKEVCRQNNIPLFKTSIKDFPEGWRRLV